MYLHGYVCMYFAAPLGIPHCIVRGTVLASTNIKRGTRSLAQGLAAAHFEKVLVGSPSSGAGAWKQVETYYVCLLT